LNNRISNKDKKDWENFLSNKETLPNKDFNNSKTKNLKTLTFDLHGYSLEEANSKIDFLIKNSYENGVGKLIIVTGKGLHSKNEKDPYVSKDLGILKYSVPDYINNSKELMILINEIKDASIEDGGSGAFYIFLKKKLIK
jgi:DNA-nicking Smr family endonuclease